MGMVVMSFILSNPSLNHKRKNCRMTSEKKDKKLVNPSQRWINRIAGVARILRGAMDSFLISEPLKEGGKAIFEKTNFALNEE